MQDMIYESLPYYFSWKSLFLEIFSITLVGKTEWFLTPANGWLSPISLFYFWMSLGLKQPNKNSEVVSP